MKITAFGYIFEMNLRKEEWEDELISKINREISKSDLSFHAKIERIKAIRRISPEQLKVDGFVHLIDAKDFAEEHWK